MSDATIVGANAPMECFSSDRQIQEMLSTLKCTKRIFIYPAGAFSQAICKLLLKLGITIDCYLDREFKKIGLLDGIAVRGLETVQESSDIIVILGGARTDRIDYLRGYITERFPNIRTMDGMKLKRLLQQEICRKSGHIRAIECERCGSEYFRCPIMKNLRLSSTAVKRTSEEKAQQFHHFGIIMGSVCNLKCKFCNEQVPFFREHRFEAADDILRNAKKIADATEFITSIALIGGEPLLHPDFDRIVEELLQLDNVGYVYAFTNGTIEPSRHMIDLLKSNDRFFLHYSNYRFALSGQLLDQANRVKELLDANQIDYYYTSNYQWSDFSHYFDLEHEDLEKLEQEDKNCWWHMCHRLSRGRLYLCPHHYAGVQLHTVPEIPGEVLDLSAFPDMTDLAKELDRWEAIPYVETCKYCRLPDKDSIIPAAQQLGSIENAVESYDWSKNDRYVLT